MFASSLATNSWNARAASSLATGGVAWPVPEPLLRSILGAASNYSWFLPGSTMRGLSGFPEGILDYLKYPVTLGGEPFREATGFKPRYELYDAFQSQRRR